MKARTEARIQARKHTQQHARTRSSTRTHAGVYAYKLTSTQARTSTSSSTHAYRSSIQAHETVYETRRCTSTHRSSSSSTSSQERTHTSSQGGEQNKAVYETQKFKQHKLTSTRHISAYRPSIQAHKTVFETRWCRAQGGLSQVSLRRGALKSTCGAVESVRSSLQPGAQSSLPGSSVQPARERFRSRLPPGGARYSLPPGGARSSLSVKRAACE